MALLKEIELASGVPVRYHRIVSVNTVTNVQDIVEVASYTSQAKREQEKLSVSADVFVDTRYVGAPYGACPTVTRAYEWLKANVADFEGANDVLEEVEDAEG